MSSLLLLHSSTFLFSIPLRSKVCTVSSLRFSRSGRGGASHCPAAGTMHWVLGAIFFRLRQVRCGQLRGQEVSKVLVPRHHPLAFPPHLSKNKPSNFQGVPCRLTGINITLSFDYWQSHSQRISYALSCIPSSLCLCLFHTFDTHFLRLKLFKRIKID